MHNRLSNYLEISTERELQAPRTAGTIRRNICPIRITRALRFAFQGLRDAWHDQPNLRVHVILGAGLIMLGVVCELGRTDWLWVIAAIGLVIFTELLNTAIEHTVDLVVGLRPDPLARRVKDVSAGCVLVSALLATLIESLIFIPKLIGLMRG